ncbi:hypothetical protein SCLCIDRAFT_971937 [Scleroderma citrinum Foug A]|uniref:Uncharacterized protein n=1 Tax=Scleroderma citrinum Foug A TaxID=1036808 RepID=A0A0C3A5Z4_9AGAM|nr:hypothetical protein SCLCIDRAFT_971937 [Scleroderma citrinum Foug A]
MCRCPLRSNADSAATFPASHVDDDGRPRNFDLRNEVDAKHRLAFQMDAYLVTATTLRRSYRTGWGRPLSGVDLYCSLLNRR